MQRINSDDSDNRALVEEAADREHAVGVPVLELSDDLADRSKAEHSAR